MKLYKYVILNPFTVNSIALLPEQSSCYISETYRSGSTVDKRKVFKINGDFCGSITDKQYWDLKKNNYL